MKFPTDTLAHHKGRALTFARSLADVPCSHIAKIIKVTVDTYGKAVPETEALWFYMANHGMSEIGKKYDLLEPLPADVLEFVEHYYTHGTKSALRLMSYLMLICVRESRHLANKPNMQADLIKRFGADFYDYLSTIDDDAEKAQQMFAANPPKGEVHNFVAGISWQFYNGAYSSSYGGEKWGVIADCLHRFVKGETTAEMMLDTGYTLAHNGAQIFNKFVLFQNQNDDNLKRILDIQRAGMIPQAIATDKTCNQYVTSSVHVWNNWLRANFPETAAGDISWQRVKDLGALGTYSYEIEQQAKMTPEYKAQKAVAQIAEDKKKAHIAKMAADQKYKLEHMYEISKDLWVNKFQPERLAKAA